MGKINPEKKIDFALEEFKQLRADLLLTKGEMQKTFVYSLTLSALGLAFIGNIIKDYKQEYVQAVLLMLSGVFFLLALNYVSHMRSYNLLSNYIFNLGIYIRSVFEKVETNEQEESIESVMTWELFQTRKYNSLWSKSVFFFTWGSQPIFPILFGVICFVCSIYIDPKFNETWQFNTTYNNLLFVALTCTITITFYSLIYSLIELFEYIKESEDFPTIDFTFNT